MRLKHPVFPPESHVFKKTRADAEWLSSWITWPHICTTPLFVKSSSNRIQANTRSTCTHTKDASIFVYCVHTKAVTILFTHAPHSNVGEVNKRKEVTLSALRHLSRCMCGQEESYPEPTGAQHHRVNIPRLNPGWVDIGLVWVQDFIFLPLILVFAGSDLNSIEVICLSKAKTGTCRSWVCVHFEQGNSIRRCPFCVWG